MYTWIDRADIRISEGMDRYCQPLMRYSIALIFIWFGVLKPLGMSPEAELIRRTVYWVSPQIFLPVLGWWEVTIGLCLLFRPLIRIALLLLLLQLPGTMMPLILLPEICFAHPPFGLSLEGQYIVKNIFLVSAAFMIGGKVRAQ